ncbi:hypothetical protein, partial [Ligilactobacillus agilis]
MVESLNSKVEIVVDG